MFPQNYKCDKEGCGKGFKEQAQYDAHMEIHRMRECHLCGKIFQRKQVGDKDDTLHRYTR